MSELFNNFGPEYDDSEFEWPEESMEHLATREELANLVLNQPALFEVIMMEADTVEFPVVEE